jgi:hypothetical protein
MMWAVLAPTAAIEFAHWLCNKFRTISDRTCPETTRKMNRSESTWMTSTDLSLRLPRFAMHSRLTGSREAIRRGGHCIGPLYFRFCLHEWIDGGSYVDQDLAQDAPRETRILTARVSCNVADDERRDRSPLEALKYLNFATVLHLNSFHLKSSHKSPGLLTFKRQTDRPSQARVVMIAHGEGLSDDCPYGLPPREIIG